jgi:16S rRNA (cytosine1402-N4)-methyltransferase
MLEVGPISTPNFHLKLASKPSSSPTTMIYNHIPVMKDETLKFLAPKPGSLIVDATLGGGGHAKVILEASKTVKLIGIDQDLDAIESAKENLKEFGDRVSFVQDNFSNIRKIVGDKRIDGILFDLGVSSYQIDAAQRGFSFQADAPLDMRMDRSAKTTACDLINGGSREEIGDIIRDYGEERYFKRIASAIVNKRPVSTTSELADIIRYSIPKTSPVNTTKSIARVFQAFRIAVNRELESLKKALEDSIGLLAPKGRIVVISYHSLEDRIVKDIFKREASDCVCPPKLPACVCNHRKKLNIITKKPIIPTDKEIEFNPRARSAKLRAAEKSE